MEKYRGKKVLIVGLGKTGFALINLFNKLECEIRVTDIKPIFVHARILHLIPYFYETIY